MNRQDLLDLLRPHLQESDDDPPVTPVIVTLPWRRLHETSIRYGSGTFWTAWELDELGP